MFELHGSRFCCSLSSARYSENFVTASYIDSWGNLIMLVNRLGFVQLLIQYSFIRRIALGVYADAQTGRKIPFLCRKLTQVMDNVASCIADCSVCPVLFIVE
jgi:hypothetical protein